MGAWALSLLRPKAVLCISVVLILCFLPDLVRGGKKRPPPVKHLFGVGVAYQKVVQYKPVLVIQKHKRTKARPGWGWRRGRGWGWRGSHPYNPIIFEHHVHGGSGGHGHGGGHGDEHGGGHGHGGGHRYKRRKPHRHYRRGRGWGWRGWRRRRPRPHKGHGHGGYGAHGHHNDHGHHSSQIYHDEGGYPEHSAPARPTRVEDDEVNHSSGWLGSGGSSGGDGSYSSTGFFNDDSRDQDDHGGYETGIRELFSANNDKDPTGPPPPPLQPPSIFPFTEAPKRDGGMAKIHKAFLKTHMKHYQALTSNSDPDPTYSMDSQGAEADNPYYDSKERSHREHDDYESNEVSRRIPLRTPAESTIKLTTMPNLPNDSLKLKLTSPPPVGEPGTGKTFSDPAYFPSFDEFKKLKM